MGMVQNEKGVTLLEILISMAILSIILVTFMNFFPQMGFMNQQNKDKIQGINTAKELLVKWQGSEEVKDFLEADAKNALVKNPENNIDYDVYTNNEDDSYYFFKTNTSDFTIEIRINKTSDYKTLTTKAHQIHVQLKNSRGSLISESYGYVMSQ